MNIFSKLFRWFKRNTNEYDFIIVSLIILIFGIIFFTLFVDSYSEIKEQEYKELYLECQQSKEMRILAKEYMQDNKIIRSEYEQLMKYKLLRNKQTFESVIDN